MAITIMVDRRRCRDSAGEQQHRPIESSRGSRLRGRAHGDGSTSRPSGARPMWRSDFVDQADGYWFQTYVDGNRNGVLTADIARGIDVPDHGERTTRLSLLRRRVRHHAGRHRHRSRSHSIRDDPIQIGSSTLLSFSPTGTSTSGTVFIRGVRGNQFAVRVLGATGRTRIFEFNFGERTWLAR